ncbi:MAG: methionine--tRNA ligase [Patescibacteria group bacterium]|nr:methionine--tRNA ligase [Patescibacteria group bacterium]
MSKSFYITTTLPYVNADPHVGFAMEIIRADVIARSKKLEGYDVFFNTGTDEHGQKLFDAAKRESKNVQDYVDGFAERFRGLKDLLDISDDVHFVRTTDDHHILACQEFWKRCSERGYIYKKVYQAKYCVGCELYKTDSELNDKGECPIHPGKPVELIDEENYFFKFGAFQQPLLDFYEKNPNFVIPDFRFNEIKSFVSSGLEDFSISRLASKMSWGIPVPGDPGHVMYVWFDALVNYISTLGWPENEKQFNEFWVNGTPTQYCGKDNLRQQSAMWQAMLMAAGLPNSHQIIINGFLTGDKGIKMSKSIGNVVNPYDVVKEYGTDALRYFLLREVSAFEDSPFTMERFKEAYNSGLANGIGNLVSRIMKMAEDNLPEPISEEIPNHITKYITEKMGVPIRLYTDALECFDINMAFNIIVTQIAMIDKSIQDNKPFSLVKTNKEKGMEEIIKLVNQLGVIAYLLNPLLPETSKKIQELIRDNKKPETPLFLRKD